MSDDAKQRIADAFKKFIFENGLVNTIVSDVAREMHISKKTIYKYFPGGKEDCLYYIFNQIANESLEELKKQLEDIDDWNLRLDKTMEFIYDFAVPFVLNNQAENLNDFQIENNIITIAFRDIYQEYIKEDLKRGKEEGVFHFPHLERTFHYIYRIMSETMLFIRIDPSLDLKNEMKTIIQKLIK